MLIACTTYHASVHCSELIKPNMEEVKKTDSEGPEVLILFFTLSLLTGVLCRYFLHGTRVPYTVAVFVTGIGLGTLEYGTNVELGKLGTSVRLWAEINPDLMLFVFLPPLLFESTFSMEYHQIKRCLVQMVLLAGPGVVISTFSIGTAIHMLFPFRWNWATSLLLGGLLSATDPVAVVAFLKELGTSKKLSTIIEGESLMNDGVAIVIFRLFFQMVLGQTFNAAKVIKFLSCVSFGAIALGLSCGFLSILWLCITHNDTIIELTLTFTVSYIAYFVAEDGAEVSGILTVTALGILFSAAAKLSFKGGRQQIMHNFWEMVAYVANTLIFILSGVLIAESIHRALYDIPGYAWGYLVIIYIFLQLSRFMVVAMLYPGLKYFGYGLDWKEAIILVWSGLRGAVALALSLSVRRASDNLVSEELSKKTGALFVFFTGGVEFLTLILNGTTTQFLLHLLGKEKGTITKESAAVVAKLILPQQFGRMSMQELRAVVIEQSTIHTFVRGESIEIQPLDVGILLEGFVRETGKKDFVGAPASLFPLNAEHHRIRLGISTSLYHHKPSSFRAETRSRVIILNLRKGNMMSNSSEGSCMKIQSNPSQMKNLGSSSTFPSTYSEKKFHMHRRTRSEASITIDATMKPLNSRGIRTGETSREGSINVDDERIVRIDSPKSLCHRQFSL